MHRSSLTGLLVITVVRTAATASANAAKLHCDAEPLRELIMAKIEKSADKDCVSQTANSCISTIQRYNF